MKVKDMSRVTPVTEASLLVELKYLRCWRDIHKFTLVVGGRCLSSACLNGLHFTHPKGNYFQLMGRLSFRHFRLGGILVALTQPGRNE